MSDVSDQATDESAGDEPAWPKRYGVGDAWVTEGGLTRREYFAAHVNVELGAVYDRLLHDLRREPTLKEIASYMAELRMRVADAMIVRLDATSGSRTL
ncbi:hypothetical protein [Paraburkholderia sp. MM6662-R1]|uniref:hypothetical protein n=1 Tax=Paraburkholderia sp. MM6662-R1 TaxID=2991066 RepID=UPI003D1B0ED5